MSDAFLHNEYRLKKQCIHNLIRVKSISIDYRHLIYTHRQCMNRGVKYVF